MDIDQELFEKLSIEVEKDWEMGGLSYGLYRDYAEEILKRYCVKIQHLKMAEQTLKTKRYLTYSEWEEIGEDRKYFEFHMQKI